MKRFVRKSEIEYVLYHLGHHFTLTDELRSYFRFQTGDEIITDSQPSIQFCLSEAPLNPRTFPWGEKSIKVLFPGLKNELYSLDDDVNLIVYQDLIKSSFYLLSGFHEQVVSDRDHLGRYCYSHSLQRDLDIALMPLVNYYFEILISGFELFCERHQIKCHRKRLFDNFGFFLSHDVDRVTYYSLRGLIHNGIKMHSPFVERNKRGEAGKYVFKAIRHMLFPDSHRDPWRNLLDMAEQEKRLGIHSTFFFLSRLGKLDGRISLKSSIIKRYISELQSLGFETGIHGSYYSMEDESKHQLQRKIFKQLTGLTANGIRQHYLRIRNPETLQAQAKVGYKYDASLGFADHPGFRNGYCYPFKPYDLVKGEMIDIWELPLMLMEVSVLDYQKKEFIGIEESVDTLIREVQQFGGFISILWHNCRLREDEYPGVTQFYEDLLTRLMNMGAESVNGLQLVDRINAKG